MKERITITIDQDLLGNIDFYVDGNKIKNRSHAVELLVQKGLGLKKLRKAIILCGGKEVKSGFLKNKRTAFVEVNKKRLLEYTLELLKKNGVEEVMIILSKEAKECEETFKDGKKYGLNIKYLYESHPMGTAGALKLAKDFITEAFILCNDDNLINLGITDMYQFHNDHNAIATIALTTAPNPHEYGVALVNGNKIYTFIEKPTKDNCPSNLINSGFCIFEPTILNYIPDGFAKLEEDVFPKIISQDKLLGYPFAGQWFDVSKKDGYKKARERWKGII
jgi:NDP-sugar pyrophosphorylase family protein